MSEYDKDYLVEYIKSSKELSEIFSRAIDSINAFCASIEYQKKVRNRIALLIYDLHFAPDRSLN